MAFCQNCGAELSDNAAFCVKCGVPIPQNKKALSDDGAVVRLLVPVGRSGWAIASGYCGLLSLLPFVGVLAVLFGILAIRDIKKNPDKHGLGRAWFGIITGALTLVVYILALACAASK